MARSEKETRRSPGDERVRWEHLAGDFVWGDLDAAPGLIISTMTAPPEELREDVERWGPRPWYLRSLGLGLFKYLPGGTRRAPTLTFAEFLEKLAPDSTNRPCPECATFHGRGGLCAVCRDIEGWRYQRSLAHASRRLRRRARALALAILPRRLRRAR